jgi:hypothetical protein
MTISPMLR